MRKFLRIAVVGSIAVMTVVAQANETDARKNCERFAADNDTSADPCDCIVDAIADDPELFAEHAALQTMEDYLSSSEALRAAIDACL